MHIPPQASLDQLEQVQVAESEPASLLGATIRRHRRTPVEQLGTEALRFLLEEGEAVALVLRIALDRLERDPFQAGDFHRGDLLVAVLAQPSVMWNAYPELRARAFALVGDVEPHLGTLAAADRAIVDRAIRAFRALWPHWS